MGCNPTAGLPQQAGVFSQPTFGHPVIGTDALHFPPEPGRVVHLPQMHQFVQTDIVTDECGCLDEPPVQGNRAAPRTGAPARFLIAHRDAAHGQSVPGGQFQHARWQFPRGQLAKMAFDGRSQIGRRIRNPDRLVAEADGSSFAVQPGFNADRFAAQKNLRPNCPDRRFPGLRLEPLNSRSSQAAWRSTNCRANSVEPPRGMVTRAVPSGRNRSR